MILECDPAYNDQQDPSDPRFGQDEPIDSAWGEDGEEAPGSRISRPDDVCPITLRLTEEATEEYERAIYEDHCCDQDDAVQAVSQDFDE